MKLSMKHKLTEAAQNQYPDHVRGSAFKRGTGSRYSASYYGFNIYKRGNATEHLLVPISKVTIIDDAIFFLKQEDTSFCDGFKDAANNQDIRKSNNMDLIRIDDGSGIGVYMPSATWEKLLASGKVDNILSDEQKDLLRSRLEKPAVANPHLGETLPDASVTDALVDYFHEHVWNQGRWQGECASLNNLPGVMADAAVGTRCM